MASPEKRRRVDVEGFEDLQDLMSSYSISPSGSFSPLRCEFGTPTAVARDIFSQPPDDLERGDGGRDNPELTIPPVRRDLFQSAEFQMASPGARSIYPHGRPFGVPFSHSLDNAAPVSQSQRSSMFTSEQSDGIMSPPDAATITHVPAAGRPAILLPLDGPAGLFSVSPFGVCCSECPTCIPIPISTVSFQKHIASHHQHLDRGLDVCKELVRSAGVEVARLNAIGDYPSYVTGDTMFGHHCSKCGMCTLKESNAKRHCSGERNDCSTTDLARVLMCRTVCGRFVLASTVHQERMPACRRTSHSVTEAWLESLISRDENATSCVSLFHPVAPNSVMMSGMVDSWTLSKEEKLPDLADLLSLAESWLMKRAKHDVACVPADFRAKIQVFDGQDVAAVSINHTCTFRHFPENLKGELLQLLCFAWRRSSQSPSRGTISRFMSSEARARFGEFLVPEILSALFVELTPSYYEHPVVVEYCISRFFRKRADGTLFMIKCDLASSQVASTMSILKAAVCSKLCKLTTDAQAVSHQLAREVRECRTSNILCPLIRLCKQMHERKGVSRPKTISPEGDIAVDNYEFPIGVWSMLNPHVHRIILDQLFRLLQGDNWLRVLDTSVPVHLDSSESDGTVFHVGFPGYVDGMFSSEEVVVKQNVEKVVYDRLVACVSLAFFGLSGGVNRGTEVDRVDFTRGYFHRNTFYYITEVLKGYSFRTSSRVKTVTHKLPAMFARQYLLLRLIAKSMGGAEMRKLIPRRASTNFTLADATTEIFSFHSTPSVTQIRQFFVAVSTYLFPNSSSEGILSATEEVAQLSGHSATTQRSYYGSTLHDGPELIYRKFHLAFGGDINPSLEQPPEVPLTREVLLKALRVLLGPVATWTSWRQEQMVEQAANVDGANTHVGLSCGSGKSMVWLVPLVGRNIAGLCKKTILVVLPYKFLMAHHLHSALSLEIDTTMDMDIVGFTSEDMGQNQLPPCFRDRQSLPDLCFLTLDALVKLVSSHSLRIKEWVAAGLIHRIVIDEVHTVFGERYRSAYEVLPKLASLNIPVTTMSGSLPPGFRDNLFCHLGMCDTRTVEQVKVVESENLLGVFPPGFQFIVEEVQHHLVRATHVASELLKETPRTGVHIIVSSKAHACEVFETLSSPQCKGKLVTADTSSEDEASIAREWSKGSFQLLVSTTSALVGNENSACRHVLVVGYLFNLINIVQAVGRLRPSQRQDGGTFGVFLPVYTEKYFQQMESRNEVLRASLKSKNLVGDDKEMFNTLLTVNGIHEWVVLKESHSANEGKCRVQDLTNLFGLNCPVCHICELCVGEGLSTASGRSVGLVASRVQGSDSAPVASALPVSIGHAQDGRLRSREETAEIANSKLKGQNDTLNRAMRVLKGLEHACRNCRKEECNGEGCLDGCYNCGKNHWKSKCPERNVVATALHGKACYSCFDPHTRRGYKKHDPKDCVLKRRLRRLVLRKAKKTSTTLAQVLGEVYSTDDSFCAFVATFAQRNRVVE